MSESVSGENWIRSFSAPMQSETMPRKTTPGQTTPGRTRLVCFPHAGGSASFFFPVSTALRGAADVLAVQYPGRQDRRFEAPVESITVMAEHVHAALRAYRGERLVFFGHSMGAIVAYEVARRMAGEGAGPARLVVSGRRGPATDRAENVHQRDDVGILRELKGLSGTDPALLEDEEVAAMILPAVRADYRAIETYVHAPGAALSCPITAFIGDRDPYATLAEVEAWGAHTSGGFGMEVFAGGHFYLTARPGEVIARLAALLSAADGAARAAGTAGTVGTAGARV